jgi:hypothetical protein
MLPRKRGFPAGYYVWPLPAFFGREVHARARVYSVDRSRKNDHKQTKEEKAEKEEDGAGNLPRSQRVLDYASAVLAMGEGRHNREDAG